MQPLDDLTWFFQDSAAAVGVRAQCMTKTSYIPSASAQREPTEAMRVAAGRQRRIAAVIQGLSSQHQAVLECAYSFVRPAAGPAASDHDPARAVLGVIRAAFEAAIGEASTEVRCWAALKEQPDASTEAVWRLDVASNRLDALVAQMAEAEALGLRTLVAAHDAFLASMALRCAAAKADVERRVAKFRARALDAPAERRRPSGPLPSAHDAELDTVVSEMRSVMRGDAWLAAHGLGDV